MRRSSCAMHCAKSHARWRKPFSSLVWEMVASFWDRFARLSFLVAMPVSLAGRWMRLRGGCSLFVNLLTILAIVLAVGLVVDDAIVVVENIQRHVQEGMDRRHACGTNWLDLIIGYDHYFPEAGVHTPDRSLWFDGDAIPRVRIYSGRCGGSVSGGGDLLSCRQS
ncbi:MAG: efflux RND transporter permease subunit [Pirellulaceae bacterium]